MLFKIVEGLPQDVEKEVSALLQQGWHLNGSMFNRTSDGHNIAVQGMTNDSEANLVDYAINVLANAVHQDKTYADLWVENITTTIVKSGGSDEIAELAAANILYALFNYQQPELKEDADQDI